MTEGESKGGRVHLTNDYVKKLKPTDKWYSVADDEVIGLQLRVTPRGAKIYQARGRLDNGSRLTISLGSATQLTVKQARDLGRQKIADARKGQNAIEEKRRHRAEAKAKAMTLEAFLEGDYDKWASANRKDGPRNVPRLKSAFKTLLLRPLQNITAKDVEDWRSERVKAQWARAAEMAKKAEKDKKAARTDAELAEAALSATTARELRERSKAAGGREIALLKACLSRAVQMGHIEKNPLRGERGVKLAKVDRRSNIRAITPEEESRLFDELLKREEEIREELKHARDERITWVRGRPVEELSEQDTFTDFFRPYLTLLLHTGMRRNEGFQLRWADVDFDEAELKVRAGVAKSGRERTIPLDGTALKTLRDWRDQSSDAGPDALVFPSPHTGSALTTITTAWRNITKKAGMKGLRLHDLRHTFATRALSVGGNIAEVQALLGHADITTTAVYLHPDKEGKRRIVDAMNARTAVNNTVPFTARAESAEA